MQTNSPDNDKNDQVSFKTKHFSTILGNENQIPPTDTLQADKEKFTSVNDTLRMQVF